jgi:hypothetical protein
MFANDRVLRCDHNGVPHDQVPGQMEVTLAS